MPEHAKLLRALPLFSALTDKQVSILSSYLKERKLKDGEILFEEGEPGQSLFFVVSGAISISKGTAEGSRKELSVMNPGDCFGEMTILEPAPRSARACARGKTSILELSRQDLERWTKQEGALAASFFAGLLQIQSQRLRRTSTELTLLYDLSTVLLEPWTSAKDLMTAALGRILPHLGAAWSAAACLRNEFNDEVETLAAAGTGGLTATIAEAIKGNLSQATWMGEKTFCAPMIDPHGTQPLGFLIFRCGEILPEAERAEYGRALAAAAHLATSAAINVRFRLEDKMRERLRARSQDAII